ncbi:MAG: AI-2E family transporter [Gammaproteobacteria bacterium]|nr:AI-2E family transporter [Gammaproteobacteria bacterium]
MHVIEDWLNQHFSNEEAIYLVVLITVILVALATLGSVLAPVLTGLVVAFLLQGLVKSLERSKMPRLMAVLVSFFLFLSIVFALVLVVVPLLWQQLQGLLELLPAVVGRAREGMEELAVRFPEYVTPDQISSLLDQGARELGNISGSVLETAFSQVFSLLGLLLYLVLVPISVFFFLKDKDQLLEWMGTLLPNDRPLLIAVGNEMNEQLGNYVRGKAIEILLVGATTFICFSLLGLNYAALLSVLVGISVLIPFVGAALVTIPVFIVAVIQFGWTWDLGLVMIVYGVIQFLDGNVLVPLLFSEAVDLHPITIIVAVLAFGGLWGVWGVFFAIPLATLIKAIYKAWPRIERRDAVDEAPSS